MIDIDTTILANIGLVYERLMEGKAQYDEVMRVCEALVLISTYSVFGTEKTSAARPGTQQDKKGTKQTQQLSSDSVIFDVVSKLEIIQNSTNKAQTQDLIKKCLLDRQQKKIMKLNLNYMLNYGQDFSKIVIKC